MTMKPQRKYAGNELLRKFNYLISFPLIILSIISSAYGGETEHFVSGVAGIKTGKDLYKKGDKLSP